MSVRHARSRWGRWLRWAGIAAAVCVFIALTAVDQRLKQAPHGGFIPETASWRIHCRDLPLFWQTAERTPGMKALLEAAPQLRYSGELRVRLATGIRPTPARWRVWFGSAFTVAGLDNARGCSFKPGILLHAAHCINRLIGPVPDASGVYRFRRFHYAWREGYVIVSASPDYVAAALRAGSPLRVGSMERDECAIAWNGAESGSLRIRAGDGWAVSGSIPGVVTQRTRPLTLAGAWPDPAPILVATATRAADLPGLAAAAKPLIGAIIPQGSVSFENMLAAATGQLAQVWGTGPWAAAAGENTEECAFALTGMDANYTLPVPEVALIARTPESRSLPEENAPEWTAFPHEWNGVRGVVYPFLGEAITGCFAPWESGWIMASRERVMGQFAGRIPVLPDHPADAYVRLDWPGAADAAQTIVRTLAQHELLPGMNLREAEALILPGLRALGGFGVAYLDLWSAPGGIRFEGRLTSEAAP